MSLASARPAARLLRAWPLAFGAALAGLVLAWTLWAGLRPSQPPTEQLQYDLVAGELVPGATLGQTFVARYGRVRRVDVMLTSYARRLSGPLIFHLKRSPEAAEDLRTVTIDAAQVKDDVFHTFEFPPAPNGLGERLYFSLEAPAAVPGYAVTAWGSSADAYPGGQAVTTEPLDPRLQDLTFRVVYAPTAPQALAILLERVTDQKPGVFGAPAWYVALGLTYLALLIGLGWLVASTRV